MAEKPLNNAADERDVCLISGSGRSPGEGNSNPGFLPGKFHGQRGLVDCSPQGRKEPDTTEWLRTLKRKVNSY